MYVVCMHIYIHICMYACMYVYISRQPPRITNVSTMYIHICMCENTDRDVLWCILAQEGLLNLKCVRLISSYQWLRQEWKKKY